MQSTWFPIHLNFNPHLPCGRWQGKQYRQYFIDLISIHTFLAEGDVGCRDLLLKYCRFQSTPSLRKVTSKHLFWDSSITEFQSTPSLRKVTRWHFKNLLLVYNFNPHLPCGRWQPQAMDILITTVFQSTPSLRKVTKGELQAAETFAISIHTFLAEGDFRFSFIITCNCISIHTFLAEGDC